MGLFHYLSLSLSLSLSSQILRIPRNLCQPANFSILCPFYAKICANKKLTTQNTKVYLAWSTLMCQLRFCALSNLGFTFWLSPMTAHLFLLIILTETQKQIQTQIHRYKQFILFILFGQQKRRKFVIYRKQPSSFGQFS